MKTIFIIDDNDTNLSAAENALEDLYRVMTLPSAASMFSLLERFFPSVPDLILLDIEMPNMNGFEALARLKSDFRYDSIPVIFLTGVTDESAETIGFNLGAVDFVNKPFSAPRLLNRIKYHLNIDEIIRERTEQLKQLQNSIVFVLADMLENRDKVTGGHVERTTSYLRILIQEMQNRGLYTDELDKWDIDMTISSARLHDVGKVVISDSILNKPDKLTPDEFNLIKTHSSEGERIIDQMMERTGAGGDSFLQHAKIYTNSHHERWDGTGYPLGLKGKEIPLQGRIMAIADVYDALVSERPYKQAYSADEAARIIEQESGYHFDPAIIQVFMEVKHLFAEVKDGICLD